MNFVHPIFLLLLPVLPLFAVLWHWLHTRANRRLKTFNSQLPTPNSSLRFTSQLLLATASLLYGGWFAYMSYIAFYVYPDALSGVAVIVAGFTALPVLGPMWVGAWFVESKMKIEPQS